MAAKQFVNVFKANAEITRLDAELTTANANLATAQAAIAAHDPEIEKNAEQVSADLVIANTNLAASAAMVTQLTNDLATAKLSITSISAERDAATAKLADPKGTIAVQAATRAAEITSAQGQPVPIKVVSVTAPGAAGQATMKRADFDALNHDDRNKFMRSGGKLVD